MSSTGDITMNKRKSTMLLWGCTQNTKNVFLNLLEEYIILKLRNKYMDISVIVPLYKGKRYIETIICMVSENQKILVEHGRQKNIEIILVNDYPTENIGSLDIFSCNNISVHLYENAKNFGIHESRLKGLSMAKGNYIVFLDQDDEIKPSYLWRQLEYLGKADVVICNGICRNNKIIYNDYDQQRQAISKNIYLRRGNTIVSPGQILLKKETIPEIWTRYILQENGSDDVFLWTLMLCEGRKFAINPHIEYLHKEDGENTSLNFVKMRKSVMELLAIIKKERLLNDNDLRLFTKMSEERVKKYEGYIELSENWDKIIENIIKLFAKTINKKIAIYGYGVIGKKLLQDLKERNIKPICVIDKAALNFKDVPYKICKPDDTPTDLDYIIMTPIFAKTEIINSLSRYTSKIIPINNFI